MLVSLEKCSVGGCCGSPGVLTAKQVYRSRLLSAAPRPPKLRLVGLYLPIGTHFAHDIPLPQSHLTDRPAYTRTKCVGNGRNFTQFWIKCDCSFSGSAVEMC